MKQDFHLETEEDFREVHGRNDGKYLFRITHIPTLRVMSCVVNERHVVDYVRDSLLERLSNEVDKERAEFRTTPFTEEELAPRDYETQKNQEIH